MATQRLLLALCTGAVLEVLAFLFLLPASSTQPTIWRTVVGYTQAPKRSGAESDQSFHPFAGWIYWRGGDFYNHLPHTNYRLCFACLDVDKALSEIRSQSK
jgi:hypothetical protein